MTKFDLKTRIIAGYVFALVLVIVGGFIFKFPETIIGPDPQTMFSGFPTGGVMGVGLLLGIFGLIIAILTSIQKYLKR